MLSVLLLALWVYWKAFGVWAPIVVVVAVGLGVGFKAADLRVRILLALAVGAVVSLSWAMLRSQDWNGFALNSGTELAGAVVTYLLVNLVIGQREKQEEAARERKEKIEVLIAQMGSSVHDVAIVATEELERQGHLRDGTLGGADFFWADLSGAYLTGANLSQAIFTGTNLTEADLTEANLSGARLRRTDLSGAGLSWANLFFANLSQANLTKADLAEADLTEANLCQANLSQAKLAGATLPDRTKWTSDTDMARFTDPNHPSYWRSIDPSSPAYRSLAERELVIGSSLR